MRRLAGGTVAAVLVAGAVSVTAQFGRYYPTRVATDADYDGGFQFCRVAFRGNPYGDGGGWGVDFPQADRNLSVRVSELTKAAVRLQAGEPRHLIVRLTDDVLFQCPFIMMTEVGAAFLDGSEAARLREYLLKGGFLWADDFWGSYAWDVWQQEIRKVLPGEDYPIVDLPLDHPIYRTHFVLANGVPQISSINHWLGTGHTSERDADSRDPHGRAITDAHGRIMVFMTHNTDIGDSWEREAEDPEYFSRYSTQGYALGTDVLVYAMTH